VKKRGEGGKVLTKGSLHNVAAVLCTDMVRKGFKRGDVCKSVRRTGKRIIKEGNQKEEKRGGGRIPRKQTGIHLEGPPKISVQKKRGSPKTPRKKTKGVRNVLTGGFRSPP